MKSSAKNITLRNCDDIFASTDAVTVVSQENVLSSVQSIPIADLSPFPGHPFKVKDDEDMQKTVESIKEYGVLHPALARPKESGGYQLVSGHRRKRACEIAGIDTMPVIVRNISDDEAAILMVDSNIQREKLDPSALAFAYKMKLEALKRQGARTDLTSRQVVGKSETADIVGQDAGESGRQVQRYIRLTELIPILLELVDVKKIAFSPAVELSYLKPEEQQQLLDAMDSEQATPSLSQAQRLKKFSQDETLSVDVMRAIMSEEKKSETGKVTLSGSRLTKFFPPSYTPKKMEEKILELLAQWQQSQTEIAG